MRSRKVFYYIVSLLLATMTAACTDDLGDDKATAGASGNLQVTVPLLHGDNTRVGEGNNIIYNATEEECRINSLRLFAFPENGHGELLNEFLGVPGTSFYDKGKFDGGVEVATYQLDIKPGTYRIYVVANMEEVLKDKTINTEDDLNAVVLSYSPDTKPGMPAAGNIPMIYEPMENTEISGNTKTTDIIANMKFTCVKVRLNLIFDPANAGMQAALKDNGIKIQGITAKKLSSSTSLVWKGKFYAADDEEVGKGISSEMYTASSEASTAGSYYADWTRTDANMNISNKDVIGAVGTAAAAPTNIKGKWLFQGTYYLPERYIISNDQQSFLTLSGKIGGKDNSYTIPLGHTDNPETEPRRTFPRSTYYEIIGSLKSLGNITLDCQTLIKAWEPVSIDADFCHTTLWVDKTMAELTSLTTDSIYYKTNAAKVEFGCDKKISIDGGESKDFIVAAKTYNDRITFTINPDIPYSAYKAEELTGTAKVWIKANNLVKYLDVKYNIQPLFDVDPLEVTIYWQDGAATNTKQFTWTTNLGGIELEKYSSTIGSSTISIKLDNASSDARGTFSVTAGNPVTTTVHEFKAYSKDINPLTGKREERLVRVIVKPAVGSYRIYFRAINDMAYNGIISMHENKFQVNQFNGILDEYYGTGDNNNNWQDGWDGKNWNNNINSAKHNVYIYSQIGETYGTAIPVENVWFFNGNYDDTDNKHMTGDPNNPGWYYKDMAVDAQGIRSKGDNSEKTIKPGETFMIFYSFNNEGADLHRCPHHMAPGIPLFNYEDREGWILYDPTSDPYYRIFDEKPVVKDVTYTVYTKYEIKGWMCQFGVATDNPVSGSSENAQFTFWDNRWNGHTAKSMEFSTENINGTTWHVTKIRLKAVDGYHEKSILVQANEKDTGINKTIFGGNSYERYGDVGYFDNTSWHPGKPQ